MQGLDGNHSFTEPISRMEPKMRIELTTYALRVIITFIRETE